jgi:hypothetical protein
MQPLVVMLGAQIWSMRGGGGGSDSGGVVERKASVVERCGVKGSGGAGGTPI